MALLRANCPRCKTQNSTFDVTAQKCIGYKNIDWKLKFEIFSICRSCNKSTVFIVENNEYIYTERIKDPSGLVSINTFINDIFEIVGFICVNDFESAQCPEFTPNNIADAFKEGAKCTTIGCWNAAGAMFRTSIDLATKSLLPAEDQEPNNKIRRSLGLRLEWMFQNNLLAPDLKDLAEAVQQDGNDGVHDASLSEVDALDLQDFTTQLLTRIFTVPGRTRQATERRKERRSEK